MNIFSKSVKKTLTWKALNMLVVFSMVSMYALPLASVVYAEEVSVSVSEVSDQSVVDTSGASSVDTESQSEGESESNESESDTTTSDVSQAEESEREVLGTETEEVTSLEVPEAVVSEVKTDECDKEKEGCVPPLSVANIRVCKAIFDEKGTINPETPNGVTFTVPWLSNSDFGASAVVSTPASAVFTTPLTLNADLFDASGEFGTDGVNDSQCITYTDMAVSTQVANSGYFYGPEILSSLTGWSAPKYNDKYGLSNPGGLDVYDGTLFDGDTSNDGGRDQKRDGHITLSTSAPKIDNVPTRTLLVANTYTAPVEQCENPVTTNYQLKSDTSAIVKETGLNAVATFVHSAWTSISGATWIWETPTVVNPTQAETKTFKQYFLTAIDGEVTSATLTLAADNQFKAWLNRDNGNTTLLEDATEFNYGATKTHVFTNSELNYFNDGGNHLEIEVTNMAGDQNPENNPAGTVYQLDYTVETCGDEPAPYCGDGQVNQTSEECDGGANCNSSCELIDDENPICNPEINLVSNGGFEAPVVTGNGGDWEIVPTLTSGLNWIAEYLSSNPNPGLELQAGYSGWTPYSGDQYAELDGNESTKIYQDIPTIVGATYSVDYAFSPRPGVASNMLSVGVDGVEIDTQSADGSSLSNTAWLDDSVTFVATNTTTRVSFQNNDTSDSLGTFVDSVSVRCVEEDGNGGEETDLCGNSVVDLGEDCDEGAAGSATCSTSCTVIENTGGGSNGGGSNGGSSSGSSSRSGSRISSSSDGEVLGESISDNEVLGATLAQTGTDFSPISFIALVSLALFLVARRKESRTLA